MFAVFLLLVSFMLCKVVLADESGESSIPKIKFSGLFNIRLARTGEAGNWSECPDPTGMACSTTPHGSTRYGGNGNTGKTFFDLSQLTLDVDAQLTPKISMHNQLDIDVQSNGPSRFGGSSLNLIESYLKFKNLPVKDGELRLGIFTPLFSRENNGPHWSTLYTITPSAINTWLATIIRVYGVDAVLPLKNTGFNVTLGFFTGADEGNPKGPGAGKDLVARGWLMHDYWMPVSAVTSALDNNIGFYGKLKYEDPKDNFDIDAGYYDNNGAVTSTYEGDVWRTKFFELGTRVNLGPNARIMGQYVEGTTADWEELPGDVYAVHKCRYQSYYLMGVYVLREQGIHFALRYDNYKVNRFIPSFFLRNEGAAWTFAMGKQFSDDQSLTLEVLSMKDKIRNGVNGDVPDNLFQLSYKIPF